MSYFSELEIMEHNLKVEREARDHYHEEIIQMGKVIEHQRKQIERRDRLIESIEEMHEEELRRQWWEQQDQDDEFIEGLI